MRRTATAAATAAAIGLWAGLAAAQESPAIDLSAQARESANVTIYNAGVGLVREVRRVDLPAGTSALRFLEVASAIRPETVAVRPAQGSPDFAVLEQNFKYDVLNPTRLMELYVDRELVFVRRNPRTGAVSRQTATLLSTAEYGYVHRSEEGISFGLPGRVVVPELPPHFVERPTLEWLVEAPAAGSRSLEVSYLTAGMRWNADYVLLLAPGGESADFTGWVTLRNESGIGFPGATLQLVAGQVNLVAPAATATGLAAMPMAQQTAYAPPAEPQFVEEGMFEYHLYTLQRPTDLADREQKQIELLGTDRLRIEKTYKLYGDSYYYVSQYGAPMENLPVSVWLEFENSEDNGMGIPLPAGAVRVYQADADGGRQFVGEDRIDHTPRQERVELQVGRAFDIVAERKQTDYEVLGESVYETEWEIRVRNRKSRPVTVELREPMAGDWEVLDASLPYERESASLLLFEVPVNPDQQVVVTYRVRTSY